MLAKLKHFQHFLYNIFKFNMMNFDGCKKAVSKVLYISLRIEQKNLYHVSNNYINVDYGHSIKKIIQFING